MKTKMQIDIISDVACPWCYVGKKNLEKAISSLPDTEVEVNWHPYQLDPTIPSEGIDRETYFTNKFGSMERYEQLAANLKAAGKKAGIDFAEIKRAPNTLKLHQLLFVAGQEGIGNELKERFFQAYFIQPVDLTKEETLVQIMSEFGWSEQRTVAVLNDESIVYQVKMEINNAYNMQVAGVPYFIVNNKYSLRGAQPPEVFMQAIQQIGTEMEQEAAACAVDDPNC